MLDKSKLLKLIENQTDSLFYDHSNEFEIAKKTWQTICRNPEFAQQISALELPFILPEWTDNLADVITVNPKLSNYKVISTDGSQIYPDRHQGTSCFLINIGSVVLEYSQNSGVKFSNEPFLHSDNASESNVEIVDCLRQELEFKFALNLMTQEKNQTDSLYLFDGSLIFWHLESKSENLCQEYLGKYLGFMYQFYKNDFNIAGFISLPKSKDLVNLIRAQLLNANDTAQIEHVLDLHVAEFFLQENQRSIIFKSNSLITKEYPTNLHPYFFYLDVGCEIVRIEIPYYIACNKERVDKITSIILDQCKKGYGYPVVIAEAHEQAVIKGPDRDFFYQMIYKLSSKHKRQIITSRKSLKKQLMGI